MDPLLSCLVIASCLHSVSTQASRVKTCSWTFLSNELLGHRNTIIYILMRSQFIVVNMWREWVRASTPASQREVKDFEMRQEASWVLSIKAERISFIVFCSRPFVISLNRRNEIKKRLQIDTELPIRFVRRPGESRKSKNSFAAHGWIVKRRQGVQRTDSVGKQFIYLESKGAERHFITTRGHRQLKSRQRIDVLFLSEWIHRLKIHINAWLAFNVPKNHDSERFMNRRAHSETSISSSVSQLSTDRFISLIKNVFEAHFSTFSISLDARGLMFFQRISDGTKRTREL